MDADEFIRSVSSTELLTTEESLSLILMMKGSTPKKEIAFSSVERGGAWTEEFFKGLRIVSQPRFSAKQAEYFNTGPSVLNTSIPFQINYGKNKTISIKSVFLINNTNSEFSSVRLLDSEGKISKLQNRTYVGCQLYAAVFNPRVTMQQNTTVPIVAQSFSVQQQSTASIMVQQSFSSQQQPPCPSTLQGHQTIGADPASHTFLDKTQAGDFTSQKNPNTNTTITMQSVPWNFVVGFKFKTM